MLRYTRQKTAFCYNWCNTFSVLEYTSKMKYQYATPVRWMDYFGQSEVLTNMDVKMFATNY